MLFLTVASYLLVSRKAIKIKIDLQLQQKPSILFQTYYVCLLPNVHLLKWFYLLLHAYVPWRIFWRLFSCLLQLCLSTLSSRYLLGLHLITIIWSCSAFILCYFVFLCLYGWKYSHHCSICCFNWSPNQLTFYKVICKKYCSWCCLSDVPWKEQSSIE